MNAMLEVNGLNKSFGGIKATDDLNLSVETGFHGASDVLIRLGGFTSV